MVESIRFRHLGGSELHAEGSEQEFSQARIRIGRGADCDLQFDPHADRSVSTVHAEIVALEGEVWAIDRESRNGLFVNDERIDAERCLQPGDVLRLGSDGPRFAVDFANPGQIATTPDAMPETVYVAGNQEQGPPDDAPDGVDGPHTRDLKKQLAGKKSIGVNTLLGVVNQTVQRERRRTRLVVVPIALTLVAVVAAILFWPDDAPREWRDVVAEPTKSIYVCAMLSGGNARPFGSAWSLGDGLLATNSHVAEEFLKKTASDQFVVRSCTTPPKDLRIDKVTLHPAYAKWSELTAKYDPFIPGQGFQRMLPPAFDVALLHVKAEDIADLAPAVPIADRDELLDLAPGDPVALLGYPMEAQAGRGVNMTAPYPQLRAGTISRTTDWFLGADVPAKRQLVGLSLSSAGGASGSPVFNKNGRVVAVNSAGDYLMLSPERRIGSGGAYGQRVDVLLDLIAGEVTGPDSKRLAELEADFLRRFRQGLADPDPFARWLASQSIQKGERLGSPEKFPFEIRIAGAKGAVPLNDHKPKKNGDYVRVVFPVRLPVPPKVSSKRLIGYVPDPAMRYFLLDRWTRTAGNPLQMKVEVAADADVSEPLPYMLYWFPVEK